MTVIAQRISVGIDGTQFTIRDAVDSEMLSSEKSIFENYDCGDPHLRENAVVMVKTMHQNGPYPYWDKTLTTKERKYANKTMQNDMQRIIDIFGCRSNSSSYSF